GWTTLSEVMDALGIPNERRGGGYSSRLAGILRRLRFEKDMDGKVRPRRWYRHTQPGDKQLLPHLRLMPPDKGLGRILLSVEREIPRAWPPAEPQPEADGLPSPPARERGDPGPSSAEDYEASDPEGPDKFD